MGKRVRWDRKGEGARIRRVAKFPDKLHDNANKR
jgi:hypothetical protein